MNADFATINEFINTIRRLARSGRSGYNNYLIKPLTTWGDPAGDDFNNLKTRINIERRRQSPYDLPQLFKKAIIKSVAPDQFDLTETGTLCLDFLKEMKKHSIITQSGESGEFFMLLGEPFRLFRESEFKQASAVFTEGIMTAEDSAVVKLMKRGEDPQYINMKSESDAAIEEIKKILNEEGNKFRAPSIHYLIKTANPGFPDLHRDLQTLFSRAGLPEQTYSEILKATAVVIYHEIIKSVKEGSLKRAVSLISKYTVLFRGKSDTPHYMEVDNFEKNLFSVIEKKNLWDAIS